MKGILPFVVCAFYGGLVSSFPPYSNDVYLQMALERAKESAYPPQWYNNPYASSDYRYQLYDNYQQPDDEYMQEQGKPYSWIDMEVVPDWPSAELRIGQVAGVAVNSDDNLVLFHRADHTWDPQYQLFDEKNNFLAKEAGPIADPTVLTLDSGDGSLLHVWGQNKFYMPHGITIDSENNLWLIDVAAHQVYKFTPGSDDAALVLGKAFEPAVDGSDTERFCKPTDVAVSRDGTIFVSDGYCNSRVMRFSADGKFERQFGEGQFDVPHSLALAEDLDLICVADRENRRIACFNAGLEDENMFGQPMREYDDPNEAPIYAIEYNQKSGLLFAVNGPTYVTPATGFTIDLHEPRYGADIVDVWSPFNNGFEAPHDVTVSHNGATLYVCEITSGHNVWKFDNVAAGMNILLQDSEDRDESNSNVSIEDDEDDEDDSVSSEEEMEEEAKSEQQSEESEASSNEEVDDEISEEENQSSEDMSEEELGNNSEEEEEEDEAVSNEEEVDDEEGEGEVLDEVAEDTGKEVETDERVIDSGAAMRM